MKEKKLTDEEIVKALENCINGFDSHDGLERHSCDVCPYKEVEACGKAQMIDLLNLINRQKAEIERLTEERKTANKHDLMYWFNAYKECVKDYEEYGIKNAELQKQVDELKDKIEEGTLIDTKVKINQRVYRRGFFKGDIDEYIVSNIVLDDGRLEVHLKHDFDEHSTCYSVTVVGIEEIGQTVFYTREEAKNA